MCPTTVPCPTLAVAMEEQMIILAMGQELAKLGQPWLKSKIQNPNH